MEYSDRFPRWIYKGYPAREYEVKLGRKLFGKQRYALCPVGSRAFNKKYDFKDEETAELWLNSLNVYAEIWALFEAGEHERIADMVMWINGESPEDLEGHMKETILADLAYCKPSVVAEALRRFSGARPVAKKVRHITQLHMREKLTNPFYRQGRF